MSRPRPGSVTGPDGPPMEAGQADFAAAVPGGPGLRGAHRRYRAPEPREPRGPYGPPEPRRREPIDAGGRTGSGGPGGPGGGTGSGGPGGPAGPRVPRAGGSPPDVRLTGRGAILALLVLSFAGLLLSDWLGWGLLADVTFVAGCVVIACYAKPSDLLAVSVCPPLAFFVACVLAQLATSVGGTAAAEGTLITLATSAPWLFLGTAVTILIGLRRGLLDNIRDLRQGLRGEPDGPPEHVRRTLGGSSRPASRGPGEPARPGTTWRR